MSPLPLRCLASLVTAAALIGVPPAAQASGTQVAFTVGVAATTVSLLPAYRSWSTPEGLVHVSVVTNGRADGLAWTSSASLDGPPGSVVLTTVSEVLSAPGTAAVAATPAGVTTSTTNASTVTLTSTLIGALDPPYEGRLTWTVC